MPSKLRHLPPHSDSAADASATSEEFEARLTRALETAPAVHIPAGFAARVATLAAAQSLPQLSSPRRRSYSSLTFYLGLALLIAAMLLTARYIPAGATLLTESALAAEFIALSVYFALRRTLLR